MATSRPRKATALKEAMTKTQLVASLSEATGLPKKDVSAVLDELGVLIERHIKKRAVGTFTLPGLVAAMDDGGAGFGRHGGRCSSPSIWGS